MSKPVRDVAHDARVQELGEHDRLAPETLADGRALPHRHLDRDGHAQLEVLGAVDGSHAPVAGEVLDPEASAEGVSRLETWGVQGADRRGLRDRGGLAQEGVDRVARLAGCVASRGRRPSGVGGHCAQCAP